MDEYDLTNPNSRNETGGNLKPFGPKELEDRLSTVDGQPQNRPKHSTKAQTKSIDYRKKRTQMDRIDVWQQKLKW